MKLSGDFTLLSTEQCPGITNPTKMVSIVLLMQGTETLRCMCDDVCLSALKSCKPYSPVKVTLSYNTRFKSMKISSLMQ